MDEHSTAVAVLHHEPSEIMHPMVAQAMQASAGLDTAALEKLMELQERHEANEARRAFNAGMVLLRAELPSVITHDALVDFTNKRGDRTRYTHATLASVIERVEPILTRHQFTLHWEPTTTERGSVRVRCVLAHAQGHSIETTLDGQPDASGGKNPVQGVASTVTYLQRYTALSLLGIATSGADEPTAEAPTAESQSQVDQAFTLKAIQSLKKHGRTVEQAEEFLGKPSKQWTRADITDRLAEWAKRPQAPEGDDDIPEEAAAAARANAEAAASESQQGLPLPEKRPAGDY